MIDLSRGRSFVIADPCTLALPLAPCFFCAACRAAVAMGDGLLAPHASPRVSCARFSSVHACVGQCGTLMGLFQPEHRSCSGDASGGPDVVVGTRRVGVGCPFCVAPAQWTAQWNVRTYDIWYRLLSFVPVHSVAWRHLLCKPHRRGLPHTTATADRCAEPVAGDGTGRRPASSVRGLPRRAQVTVGVQANV